MTCLSKEDVLFLAKEYVLTQNDEEELEWYCTQADMASEILGDFLAFLGLDKSKVDILDEALYSKRTSASLRDELDLLSKRHEELREAYVYLLNKGTQKPHISTKV